MTKYVITEKGVNDPEGKRLSVGKVFEIPDDKALPGFLVNKCKPIPEASEEETEETDDGTEKTAVTNPEKGGGAQKKAK